MGISEFRVHRVYPEEMKKQAVFRVLSGELRKSEAEREYHIAGNATLDNWMERYGHGILSEHKELLAGMGTRKKKEAVKGKEPETEDPSPALGCLPSATLPIPPPAT